MCCAYTECATFFYIPSVGQCCGHSILYSGADMDQVATGSSYYTKWQVVRRWQVVLIHRMISGQMVTGPSLYTKWPVVILYIIHIFYASPTHGIVINVGSEVMEIEPRDSNCLTIVLFVVWTMLALRMHNISFLLLFFWFNRRRMKRKSVS